MIEVTIDSVRVSLVSQHRIVVLKEVGGERYLPIYIGPFEADAITIELQGVEVARPLTHDLLKRMIETLGARVSHVVVNDLQNDTFYARIALDVDGEEIEVDSRPSDAIALAVRAKVAMYVAEEVMDRAGVVPEKDIQELSEVIENEGEDLEEEPSDEDLEVFREFVEGLDLEGLGDDED
ncbi:MAG: bifunctional nuclease family protein [Anaerolineae bacterium]|nr:bifunctional nuclease family protein [Anaerolineae bacterium]MDW8098886.1 bifunctional nuclease family protein [Anaerolineae bacterium]